MLPILTTLHTAPIEPLHGRKLVYEQRFDKLKKIDSKEWTFDDGPVYNDEAQRYTKADAGYARIEKGHLVIEARKENGKILSARLQSKRTWKYGFFEFEARVPAGNGTWPAIWMLSDRLRQRGPNRMGWPDCGEIDIMENVGSHPDQFHYSLHCKKYNHMIGTQRTKVIETPHATDKFHTFGMDWRENLIVFYQDHKEVYRIENKEFNHDAWPFNEPYYMILNLAIGGTFGGKKGIDDAIFPAQFLIKSIKIYQ